MDVAIKRAYQDPDPDDGYRVLVDRLWPRGVSKTRIAIDEWCKDVAPSTQLRTWFGHDPDRFEEFSDRYRQELRASDAPDELLAHAGALTLIYAAHDEHVNHAVVLREFLEGLRNR